MLFGMIIGINYFFDFYAVFNQNREVYYGSINDRYAKVSYILKNNEKYNTFIWGSSRTQKMNPLIIDDQSYNMASIGGVAEDCLRDLKLLINNKIKIEKVYLGIDNFSYKYKNDATLPLKRVPYNEDKITNIKYLVKIALKKLDIDLIKGQLNNYELEKNHLTSTGKLEVPDFVEKKIEENLSEYVYDKKFLQPTYDEDISEHIRETVSVIRKIKKLCDDNNIKLVVFFNPVHITSYLKDDIHLSNQFKRKLVKITDFYDFNYINFITINNYFWYETSHPRYFVCDWELKVITNQYDKNIPKDFGHFITKENIDYYCNKYIIDRENFKKPSKQYIPEEPII